MLHESVNAKGFIWSDKNPAIVLDVQVRSGYQAVDINRRAWWEYNKSADFIGIRTSISCSLSDTSGNVYGSFDLDAKGVGGDEFSAKKALMKELRSKFPIKLQEAIDSQLQI